MLGRLGMVSEKHEKEPQESRLNPQNPPTRLPEELFFTSWEHLRNLSETLSASARLPASLQLEHKKR
jgi:hypothetical protein